MKKTVANLKIGEKAVITHFSDEQMSLKLLEMGCLPGTEIQLRYVAPLGDPICIAVAGYTLSMRLEEAATILVQ
ncbi:MAG: ferrous iron transport protein A [Verrucomicrobia bacterium]|nr:ferrous iron transport protein A [Cytophagales bacterium]